MTTAIGHSSEARTMPNTLTKELSSQEMALEKIKIFIIEASQNTGSRFWEKYEGNEVKPIGIFHKFRQLG